MWSAQQPYPLEAEVQDISWQIVNRKKDLDFNSNDSKIKASTSFIVAQGSMPLLHNIIKPTSTKCKADNQDELNAIKRPKTLHFSSEDAVKQNNENESDRPKKKEKLTRFNEDDTPPGTQWDGNNYGCAYDALFTILFNIWTANSKKMEKSVPTLQSVSFYTA